MSGFHNVDCYGDGAALTPPPASQKLAEAPLTFGSLLCATDYKTYPPAMKLYVAEFNRLLRNFTVKGSFSSRSLGSLLLRASVDHVFPFYVVAFEFVWLTLRL